MPSQSAVLREVWANPDSFATTLTVMLLDTYGIEALGWDAHTILVEIEDDFNVALPQLVFDRLMVGAQLLTSDSFYKNLPDFIMFCSVLSGTPYDPAHWNPVDALEVAWGVTEAMLLDPPDANDDEPFNDEIRAYIGQVLDAEGIMNPPDLLRLGVRSNPAQLQADFSDDPALFQAVYQTEAGKTADITQALRRQLQTLLGQLSQLPLRTGNAQAVVRRLLGRG